MHILAHDVQTKGVSRARELVRKIGRAMVCCVTWVNETRVNEMLYVHKKFFRVFRSLLEF